jgi:peptidylprolyl isomerase
MKRTLQAIAALVVAAALAGCAATVGDKKVVKIKYKGTLSNGSVFDSSEGKDPLEFLVGAGQIIPGLETGIKGMKVGQKKQITIKAAEAYGDYNQAAVQEVPKESFPKDMKIETGMELVAQTAMGPVPVRIAEIRDSSVMVDFNHPLAGKDLTFDVEIMSVRDATKQELASIEPAAAPPPQAQPEPAKK